MRRTKREAAILAVLADVRVGRWTNLNGSKQAWSLFTYYFTIIFNSIIAYVILLICYYVLRIFSSKEIAFFTSKACREAFNKKRCLGYRLT
jgi:hypothetical protein